MTSSTLTPKQRRFVDEYLVDMNATQAAIRAGFSRKTAAKIASQLLDKTRVRDAIAEATAARSERTQVTADGVVAELAKVAFANMLDYVTISDVGEPHVDLSRMTREHAAAVSEVIVDEYTEGRGADARNVKRTRFKLADKCRALDLLGKHLGIFKERVELSGEVRQSRAKYEAMSTMELLALAKKMGVRGAA